MIIEAHNLTVTGPGTLSIIEGVPFLAIKEKILGKAYELSVSFVVSEKAKSINQTYRGKDYVPNTLAFPLDTKSGEIIMCIPAMRAEHKKFDMDLHTYLIFLFIHSCLHLKGYAHGGTMERMEQQLLKLFSNTQPSTHGKTQHNRRH
jgi:probable rRNA maturation factor